MKRNEKYPLDDINLPVNLVKKNLEDLRQKIELAVADEDWDSAADICSKYIQLEPNDHDIILIFTHALANTGALQEAVITSSHLVKIKPETQEYIELNKLLLARFDQKQNKQNLKSHDNEITKACFAAKNKMKSGDYDATISILESASISSAHSFESSVTLAAAYEIKSQFIKAIQCYDIAIKLNPGHALPFTRRAILSYRSIMGNPPKSKLNEKNKKILQVKSLGVDGRFGNQLLQYGVARLYAEHAETQLETPDWIGRDIFGLNDAYISDFNIKNSITENQVMSGLTGESEFINENAHTSGYFCGNTKYLINYKNEFRNFFRTSNKIELYTQNILKQIKSNGKIIVAIHLRRGDYGKDNFWIAPEKWYQKWLSEIWSSLDCPILYVSTDDSKLVQSFSEYNPISACDIKTNLSGIEFYTDHYVLQNSDILATSNSTFSGTAALLNQNANQFFRPDLGRAALRDYDPWNEPILL
jgi:tetratricopeptide (TPR) repeat protein